MVEEHVLSWDDLREANGIIAQIGRLRKERASGWKFWPLENRLIELGVARSDKPLTKSTA
jgi:hypothetical protein